MEKLFTLVNNINEISERFITLSDFFIERSFYPGRYTCGRRSLHRNT